MCCKEESKLFLRKRSSSVKRREKKRGNGGRRVAGLVLIGDGTATIGREPIAVSVHSDNANASAPATPLPNRSNSRVRSRRTAISDSPDEEEKLVQWNINDLPLDVLACVVCKLKHDELKPLSRVSKKFREAVLIARESHFDFTTPSRTRLWIPFNAPSGERERDSMNARFWPPTPNAPRNTRKSQRRLTDAEIREVAVTLSSLFGDDETYSVRPRVSANRVLLREDELQRG